jgi:hypothetical protein
MATRPTEHGDTETIDHAGRSNTGTGAVAPASVAVTVAPRTAEEMAAMAAGSVGAQVILDYNGAGSLGARGGAGVTEAENKAAYDAHMVALGLDPNAPSGPPTAPDPAGAVRAAEAAGAPKGRATRISSLAAGIITGDQTGGGGGGGGAAPVNTAVPAVTQAGDTLTCTQGTWSGEPTTYGYQWTVDGAVVGTDSATHTVTAADAGKAATCIVTATNAAGSTAAPPSVALTITDPGAARSRGGR